MIDRVFRSCLAALLFAVPVAAQAPLSLPRTFPIVSFRSPVFLTHAGDGTNRLFVVEQDGVIKVMPSDSTITRAHVGVFLDRTAALTRFHNEAGLLGLAFHPTYEENGYFFVYYTRAVPDRSVVSRFSVDPDDANRADPNSEVILLEVDQPFGNHNAGMMQFGPNDGYLYISLGDGGDRRDGFLFPPDSLGNGQNRATLHSSVLRIDVDGATGDRAYGIPPDNPFAGNDQGWREEIWAYGLRNPWRFSIDGPTNRLWVADVGAKAWEEINLVEAGDNLGWSVMEATDCFREAGCATEGIKMPVVRRSHEGGCNSITGGYVYRGARRPELHGAYIYSDWCTGTIRMMRYEDGVATTDEELFDTSLRVSSFGLDEAGELYVVNHNGTIHWFSKASSATASERPSVRAFELAQNYPNPVEGETSISFVLLGAAHTDLTIYDVLGRAVRTLVSGDRPPGAYAAEWNGRAADGTLVAAGVYLYVLRSGAQREARTMLVVR